MWALAGIVVLVVPQVAAPIHVDGELDEVAWRTPARTGPFLDANGTQAAPYSDARLLRDDQFLYLALYAADEDIRSSDEFVVELSSPRGRTTLHFRPNGTLVPDIAHSTVMVDLDGSIDEPSNDDEEWVVEAAVPLASIPFGRNGVVNVRISRCDTTKDGKQHCGAWKGQLGRR
jgi:hypothetical protein